MAGFSCFYRVASGKKYCSAAIGGMHELQVPYLAKAPGMAEGLPSTSQAGSPADLEKKEEIDMKTIAKLGVALGMFGAIGYAETWNGKLVDAACSERSQQPPADSKQKSDLASCAASAATTVFAIQTSDGKVFRLDASGNAKASTALKGNPANTTPTATV